MQLIQVLFLIAIWVIPALLMINTYLKMSAEERKEIKAEFKQASVLLGVGFPVLGLLLYFSGFILTIKLLQFIGMGLVFIGFVTISILGWKRKKINFMLSIGIILLCAGGVVVGYLILGGYTWKIYSGT